MKEIKGFILAEIILILIKGVGGILSHSYTLLVSALFDLSILFLYLISFKNKVNKKYKSIISSFLSFLFMMGVIALIFVAFITDVKRPSWFLLLFLVISLFIRYSNMCFTITLNYQKKKGLLSYTGNSSTIDFMQYGIIFGSLLFSKLGHFVLIFQYADRVGVLLLSFFLLIKYFKIISHSFHNLYKESFFVEEEVLKEIKKRPEITKLHSCIVNSMGGINFVSLQLQLKDSIPIVDLNTFVISLQDYLLKYCDVIAIYLVKKEKLKKPRVRSKKEDARNSGSRNRKTSLKRKNSTQKNKKR